MPLTTSHTRPSRRRRPVRTRGAVVLAAALLAGAAVVTAAGPAPVAAADVVPTGRDGSSAATAGASCWGIHREFPSAPDGTYWLVTRALGKPQQFRCDMTTDGGGWVLVGRGREGWTFDPNGQGAASTVRSVPSGTAAFVPAALATVTVDGLLDGGPTSALPDGIRVRRAADAAGTAWQELRLRARDEAGWSWGLGGGIQLASTTVDATTWPWGNTRDSAVAWGGQPANGLTGVNDARRLLTYPMASHGGRAGFAYGYSVVGSSSSTSYLWQQATERYAVPFAQVYVRPTLANDAPVDPVPSGGLPAEPRPWMLRQRAEPAPWGVVGADHTGESSAEPWATPALVVRVVGDRVLVGGRFTGVQQGPAGVPVAQPFLAAFDRRTGSWIDSFRPRLDGRVWDLAVTPSGNVVVAGDFLSVNGAPGTTALAMLDPTTGATVTTWRASLRKESTTGERALARAVAVSGSTLYVAGRFTHLTGGSWAEIRVSNAARVDLTTGTPVAAWRPNVPALTTDISPSPAGDRVHLSGYFDRVNGDTSAGYLATLDATTGAVVPGQSPLQPSSPSGKKYQQAVLEWGDRLYVGGSEHSLQQLRRSDRALLAPHLTVNGGDTQAIAPVHGMVAATCHCYGWTYQFTNAWPTPTGYSRVDPVNGLALYDTTTFSHLPSFHPSGLAGSSSNDGIWSLDTDADECLWFAGDEVRRGFSGDAAADWLGNFGRFCPEDRTVPTTPGTPAATSYDTSVTLRWAAATDPSGPVEYWVYRNGRVVGATTSTSFVDTGRTTTAAYSVRAVDAAGNRSASTPPLTVTPFGDVLVGPRSTWRWTYPATDPPAGWATPEFDDSAWATGAGELGYGDGDEGTVISTAPTPRPVTAYFRRTFIVPDTAVWTSYVVDVVRDDGAAVLVNGTEVCRSNLPSGPLTSATNATAVVSSRTDETTPVRCEVPAGVVRPGTNTVAVEVHNSDRWSSDLSFDLRVGGRR